MLNINWDSCNHFFKKIYIIFYMSTLSDPTPLKRYEKAFLWSRNLQDQTFVLLNFDVYEEEHKDLCLHIISNSHHSHAIYDIDISNHHHDLYPNLDSARPWIARTRTSLLVCQELHFLIVHGLWGFFINTMPLLVENAFTKLWPLPMTCFVNRSI